MNFREIESGRTDRRAVLMALAATALGSVTTTAAAAETGVTDNRIKVGQSAVFTGPAKDFGVDYKAGIAWATKQLGSASSKPKPTTNPTKSEEDELMALSKETLAQIATAVLTVPVTANGKTYTFTTYTTKTDDKGISTLTFKDAKPQ